MRLPRDRAGLDATMKTARRLQAPASYHPEIIAATRKWLERAVIGLNLCPFARGVHGKGQVRCVVSEAQNDNALLDDLERELKFLVASAPVQVDTTLLITPDAADIYQRNIEALRRLGFDGWQALGVGAPAKPKP